MTERWLEVRQRLEALADLSEAEREILLEDRCPDPAIRREVERILAAERGMRLEFREAPRGLEGERVGPYRILRLLGRGGMGEVYEGEEDPPLRRRVAVKVVRSAPHDEEILARFEVEKRVLARMDHAAIARVFQAGVTIGGRPYFAMERVVGVPITAFCDRDRLTVRRRLELFSKVCAGVQHAHEQGVIHRDLKPSNILVTRQDGVPVPKIIDFGVAKASEELSESSALITREGDHPGTPAYMSPEQAAGATPSTRSDVYSLGLILSELLAGRRPPETDPARRGRSGGVASDPTPPSRLMEPGDEGSLAVARDRSTRPSALIRELRGDLDWVAEKALAASPERRYEGAGALRADIERTLAGEPVLAGPPTTLYRLRKAARRHRVAVLATAAVVLALLTGTTGTTIGLIRASRAERAAVLEARTAERVTEFLVGLFDAKSPEQALGIEPSLASILERGDERVAVELDGEPEVQASLFHALGRVRSSLGDFEQARDLLTRAVTLRSESLGPDHQETGHSLRELGLVLLGLGDSRSALEVLGRSVAILEASEGGDSLEVADALDALAIVLKETGRLDDGEAAASRALEIHRKLQGANHPGFARSLDRLARLAGAGGRFDEARLLLERALAIRRETLDRDHPEICWNLHNLAAAILEGGEPRRAESLFREALALGDRVLAPDHPYRVTLLSSLGVCVREQGRYDEAEPLLRESLRLREGRLGAAHPAVASAKSELGLLLRARGDLGAALPLLREAVDAFETALGEDHPTTISAVFNLATAQRDLGHYREAGVHFRRVLAADRRTLGDDHPNVGVSLTGLASLALLARRPAEAAGLATEAADILAAALGEDHWRTANARSILGGALLDLGRLEEAERTLLASLEVLESVRGSRSPAVTDTVERLRRLYVSMGRLEQAERMRSRLTDQA